MSIESAKSGMRRWPCETAGSGARMNEKMTQMQSDASEMATPISTPASTSLG